MQANRQLQAVTALEKLGFRKTHTDADDNIHMLRQMRFVTSYVDVQPSGAVNDLPLFEFITSFKKNRR